MIRALMVGFVVAMMLPAITEAKDPICHRINSLLFAVVENGVVSSRRVSLDIDACRGDNGRLWAEARIAILTLDASKKAFILDSYYSSTETGTVRDLNLDSSAVSFEMTPFPLAPDRPLRVVATKIGARYEAKVGGVWSELLSKKPLTIEWRQIRSIELPYPIVSPQSAVRPANPAVESDAYESALRASFSAPQRERSAVNG
jgi:hypothetical protein